MPVHVCLSVMLFLRVVPTMRIFVIFYGTDELVSVEYRHVKTVNVHLVLPLYRVPEFSQHGRQAVTKMRFWSRRTDNAFIYAQRLT